MTIFAPTEVYKMCNYTDYPLDNAQASYNCARIVIEKDIMIPAYSCKVTGPTSVESACDVIQQPKNQPATNYTTCL